MTKNSVRSDAQPERIITFDELATRFGIHWSKVSIWRFEKVGRFPKRVHLSARTVGWRESEIVAFVNERIAARVAAVA